MLYDGGGLIVQPKISMVIPCYNKAKWVGAMFDSVLAQKWDNIELILVNDGSTDGTREAIGRYEPLFRERGYEVIIIDQENLGVAAAVRNGMLRMSGEYFCTVDCDDRLASDYLALMGGWLQAHPDCDGVSCTREYGEEYLPQRDYDLDFDLYVEDEKRLAHFILWRMATGVTVYLFRVAYVEKQKAVFSFSDSLCCSQETVLSVALLGGGGKIKHLPKGLYLRNMQSRELSQGNTFDSTRIFVRDYFEQIRRSVAKLDKPAPEKECLYRLIELGRLKGYLFMTYRFPEADALQNCWLDELAALLCEYFTPHFASLRTKLTKENIHPFFSIFEKRLFGEPLRNTAIGADGRIIGYGVLGEKGQIYLPPLLETPLAPAALWDKAAGEGSCFGNMRVVKPDFPSLTDRDILLVFPWVSNIRAEVKETLERAKIRAKIVYLEEIGEYIGAFLFPELDNESLRWERLL
jgi:glycosyltransferase involved in cell wall biosynthesis